MTLLDVDEPAREERCRCCRRLLREDVSLGYKIGPKCRAKLGITPRRPLRITGVPTGWDIVGQADLFEEET